MQKLKKNWWKKANNPISVSFIFAWYIDLDISDITSTYTLSLSFRFFKIKYETKIKIKVYKKGKKSYIGFRIPFQLPGS